MTQPFTGSVPPITKKNTTEADTACATIALLSALWANEGAKYQIGMLDRKSNQFRNISVTSATEGARLAKQLSDEEKEAYFAIAGYETPGRRTAANASNASALWLDLDCSTEKEEKGKGYATTAAAEEAVKNFCKDANLPAPTHIVQSGGGLHVYWALDRFLTRDQWQAVAKKLKDLTHAHDLLADDSRTADIASVLRVPGTLNYKYDPPRPVTLSYASPNPISTSQMLDAVDTAHRNSIAATQNAVANQANTNAAENTDKLTIHKKNVDQNSTLWTGARLAELLAHIDPEEGGRPAWIAVGMALHNVTGGSSEGLELFDQWSERGATYPGRPAIEVQWRSFKSSIENGYSIGTIINRVNVAGHDWKTITEEKFQPCEYEVVLPEQSSASDALIEVSAQASPINPLDRYSLRGMSEEVARDAVSQRPILGGLAVRGQATAIFASPNSGKTLITLCELCEDIRQGRLEASKVYYVNVDDSAQGLASKLAIADEYGFHMLSEGYRDFKTSALVRIMSEMVENHQAAGVVVVLDTIKKFTNLMDKTSVSQFTKVIRQFVMKGGTVIGMAHTNKRPGADGKPVYGGTSDIVDDFDCAYTIATEKSSNPNEKIVVFENIKRRGNNPAKLAYRYSIESGLKYYDLLMSVEQVDVELLASQAQAAKCKSDGEVITAVLACIALGVNTKMKLADEVAKLAGVSKRQALAVVERYTGDDPAVHKWSYAVRERGAKVFTAIDSAKNQ